LLAGVVALVATTLALKVEAVALAAIVYFQVKA
jgi:hypothetical protein